MNSREYVFIVDYNYNRASQATYLVFTVSNYTSIIMCSISNIFVFNYLIVGTQSHILNVQKNTKLHATHAVSNNAVNQHY